MDDNETRKRIITEAIDSKKLEWRVEEGEELAYAPNQQTPYAGWVKRMRDDGQIWLLTKYTDGKKDGPSTWWYNNGQKRHEETYKDGRLITAIVWRPNGEKCPDTNVVKGNGVWVLYNEDGTEFVRHTYKDGEEAKANPSSADPPAAQPAQISGY